MNPFEVRKLEYLCIQSPQLPSEGCPGCGNLLHFRSATWVTKQAPAKATTKNLSQRNARAGRWKSGLCVLNQQVQGDVDWALTDSGTIMLSQFW